MATVWPRGAGVPSRGEIERHGFHPFDIRADPVVSAPLVSPSVTVLVPAGASGPAKVAAHVGLFIFSGCWDKGSDSPISYPTKQSPNTSSERGTGNKPREQKNNTRLPVPQALGKGKAAAQPEH